MKATKKELKATIRRLQAQANDVMLSTRDEFVTFEVDFDERKITGPDGGTTHVPVGTASFVFPVRVSVFRG